MACGLLNREKCMQRDDGRVEAPPGGSRLEVPSARHAARQLAQQDNREQRRVSSCDPCHYVSPSCNFCNCNMRM